MARPGRPEQPDHTASLGDSITSSTRIRFSVHTAGCVIVIAAFESPAFVAGLDDVTVMGQTVEQRGRHFGIAEHTRPFAEGEIGGDDDGGALVEAADEVEQELTAGLCEGQIAKLVEDDEVHAGQMFSEPALPAVAGLGLKPVDEVDDVVEASPGAIADAASRDDNRQMGLAGAGAPDQHDVALLGDEATAGEIILADCFAFGRIGPGVSAKDAGSTEPGSQFNGC
jgi:hypothetical protein